MGATGSIQKVLIGGMSFNVIADSFPERTPEREKEGIVHSGGVDQKITLMSGAIEGLRLKVTNAEYEVLNEFDESQDNIAMSVQFADSTTLRATGFIALDNHSAENNGVDVTLTPANREWTPSS